MQGLSFVPNYDKIGLMGDVHGDSYYTARAIKFLVKTHGVNQIFQLGDFGLWNGKSGFNHLVEVQTALFRNNAVMYVTPGNHEDYVLLGTAVPADLDSRFLQIGDFDRILFIPRGLHWEWNGVKYCSLGGANSIDKKFRTPNVDWWQEEQISYGDVAKTIAGGKADIMFTHDCPSGIPIQSFLNNDWVNSLGNDALEYAKESRKALQTAVDSVKPKLLFHGHYHIALNLETQITCDTTGEVYTVRSACFDKEFESGNLGVLQPEKMVYNHLEDEFPFHGKGFTVGG